MQLPVAGQGLRILVTTLAGTESEVLVSDQDTVDALKLRLEELKGIPAAKQVLVSLSLDRADCEMLPGQLLVEYDSWKVLVIRELPPRPLGMAPGSKKRSGGGGWAPLRGRKLPPMPSAPPPGRAPKSSGAAPKQAPAQAAPAAPVPVRSEPGQHVQPCGGEGEAAGGRGRAATAPCGEGSPVVHLAAPAALPVAVGLQSSSSSLPPPSTPPTSATLPSGPPSAASLGSSTPPIAAVVSGSVSPPAAAQAHTLQRVASQSTTQVMDTSQSLDGKSSGGSPQPTSTSSSTSTVRAAATAALSAVMPSVQRIPTAPAPTLPGSLSWSPPGSLPVQGAGARSDATPPTSARLPLAATVQGHQHSPGSRARVMQQSSGNAGSTHRVRRADLQRIGKLGVGAFGVVTLEADRRTGRTYALKAVSKGYLAQLRMEYSVLNEKRILKMTDSPFVVRLIATYNGKEHVYFLLEAALGGEVFTTYERLRFYGSEKHAKFYVGCVAEALAHLHERHVIYRDLKPENLLLDARGYCKLTDMGLAKVTLQKTYTLVGTPDYMAPEVILQTGHGLSVDWWMLGVLLFELLSGRAPFEAETTAKTYELVKKGIDHAKFPQECCRMAQELVRLLCKQNPESRCRMPALRDHPFFKSFDWAALRGLRLAPPFVPQVRGPRDFGNFRACEGEDPPAIPYVDTGSGWDAGFEDDALGATRALSLNPPTVGHSGGEPAAPKTQPLQQQPQHQQQHSQQQQPQHTLLQQQYRQQPAGLVPTATGPGSRWQQVAGAGKQQVQKQVDAGRGSPREGLAARRMLGGC